MEETAFTLTPGEREEVRRRLGREPSELEWAMIEALWSEHCSYKSSKEVLRILPTDGPPVLIGPGYDAGVVEIGDGYVVSIHIESHNHPSAIDPYGGAATGVGGVVRDILSVGTKPVAILNALRFGDIESSSHSRWLLRNVVKGIADYGNCIGVPTIAGDIEFDSSFDRNCLVDVACIGVGRKEDIILPAPKDPGSVIMLVGNSTGRDGMLGASFASKGLAGDDEDKRSAVQIPDPFLEKLLIDASTELVDKHLLLAIKDLGGGGLATALAEMAYKGGTGVEVELSRVHLRDPSINPIEVLLSESQERMLYVVHEDKVSRVAEILEKYELPYSIIGKVIEEKVVRIYWKSSLIANIPTWVVEAPTVNRSYRKPRHIDDLKQITKPEEPRDMREILLRLLESPNICSRRWVYEQYDHEVGVRTVVKPGEADAALIKMPNGSFLAVKLDGDSKKCYIDPYKGSKLIVSENLRNLASTGAKPIAVVDHQQFGSPEDPEVYYCFRESVRGLADYCKEAGIPVVGGKVSFYNEDELSGQAIKPSPLIGGLGIVSDSGMITTSSLKRKGDYILVIGITTGEIGGSEYYTYIHKLYGGPLPEADPKADQALINALLSLRRAGIISAAHDVSKGGLAVALAEMCIAGRVGAAVDILNLPTREDVKRVDDILFSEGGGRIVAEVRRDRLEDAKAMLRRLSIPFGVIGEVRGSRLLVTRGEEDVLEASVKEMERRWSSKLERVMEGL